MKTIDALIEEAGTSVIHLAQKAGLALQRTQAIVDGCWLPSPAERQKIAAALGVEVDSISWGHTMSPRVVRYHRFGLKEDFRQDQ